MKSWEIWYGMRPEKGAQYEIVEGPWWIFFIQWFFDDGPLSCGNVPKIPFPNIGRIKDINEETGEVEAVYTMKEWYGDLSSWWHAIAESRIHGWAFMKLKRIKVAEIDMETLKERHPEEYRKHLEHEARRKREEEEDDE